MLITCAAASLRTRCLMLDFTVMLALTSSSRALTAENSWETQTRTTMKTWLFIWMFLWDLPLNIKPAAGDSGVEADRCIHSLTDCLNIKAWFLHAVAAVIHHSLPLHQCERERALNVMCSKVRLTWGWQDFFFFFFTSMKLLFHSLAWILRTAWPEKLWRGHWNRTQRADPKRQSWRGKRTAEHSWDYFFEWTTNRQKEL